MEYAAAKAVANDVRLCANQPELIRDFLFEAVACECSDSSANVRVEGKSARGECEFLQLCAVFVSTSVAFILRP